MEEIKIHKARQSHKESKDPKSEIKSQITYNDIRAGINNEVNDKFASPSIVAYERNQTDTIVKLMDEFEEDTAIPTDLDLLFNFNASINLMEAKWLRRYNAYNKGLETNTRKLEVLEAIITQEYKRNPDVHNGLLLSDKEIKNLIIINPDHIELEEKINNIKAVMSVVEKAMARIDSISYRISNAINILRVKNNLQW